MKSRTQNELKHQSLLFSRSSCSLLFVLQKDGADPFDLAEVLPELQRSQRQELWERQLKLLQHCLTAHPPERWITGAEDDAGDMEVEISEEQVRLLMFRKRQKTKSFFRECVKMTGSLFLFPFQIQTMAVIDGVTIVSTVSVDILQENDNYTSLLECAQTLNCKYL